MPITPFPSPNRQRGIATLFIILMVGLAVSVSVVASIYAVRGAQTQQLTTHTATAAQAAAWRGVEALRRYLVQVDRSVWPTWVGNDVKPVNGLSPLGVSAASLTFVNKVATDHYQVGARVTGTAGIGDATTTSTVEVVYDIAPGLGTPGAAGMCHSLPRAPMVFNGDLHYTGGQFDSDQGTAESWDYKNIVVAGKLTVEGGSAAKISGCVKGDVDISGGGLTDNGHIYSEGTISLRGMGFPVNTALWGRALLFDGGSGGPPNMAWAGGWQTDVYSQGQKIGSAVVGGKLLANSISPTATLPWSAGVLVPAAGKTEANTVLVMIGDDPTKPVAEYLLDLSQLTIDPATGIATGAAAAAQQIAGDSGSFSFPDTISFHATGVVQTDNSLAGGSVSMTSSASLGITGTTWGQDISLLNGKYDFPTVLANGNLTTGSGTAIGSLTGGGSLFASAGNCTSNDGYPGITAPSAIAGDVTCSSGSIIDVTKFPAVAKVATRQAGTTPGLPGLPYCDARVSPVDTDSFKSSANFVFENVNGAAQLTIQHVNLANGNALDGVYPLTNPTPAQQAVLESLMTCNNGNDKGCRQILQSAAGSVTFGQGSIATPKGTWNLKAVTQFPAGVAWFDNVVVISGNAAVLTSTIINKGGKIIMPNTGSTLTLQAPNLAGAAATCGGATYPTNLCASRTTLATWKDEAGAVHTGLPIGNMAIITDNDLASAGWTIKGSVVLGGKMMTSGATVNITGSLTVGSNNESNTDISAGGLHVTTPIGGDTSQLPICSPGTSATTGTLGAAVLWSRYL